MENSRLFDWIDGIPDTETKKAEILEYYKKIQREFKKISKEDILKKLHMVDIIIDEECDCDKKTYPKYRMYMDGTSDIKVQGILKKAIDNFIEHGYYFFHYDNNQLQRELPEIVEKCLNNNNKKMNIGVDHCMMMKLKRCQEKKLISLLFCAFPE